MQQRIGDPKECKEIITEIRKLRTDTPISTRLGHQLMALATGAGRPHKMNDGHQEATIRS